MKKQKQLQKKTLTTIGTLAAVLCVVILAIWAKVRFFTVPETPVPGDLLCTISPDSTSFLRGDGYCLAILPVSSFDGKESSNFLIMNGSRRVDVLVMPSYSEELAESAMVVLSNLTVKSFCVPSGTPGSFMKALQEKYPELNVVKMALRRYMQVGDLLLCNYATGKLMQLEITHGSSTYLYNAKAMKSSKFYQVAFLSPEAAAGSGFTCENVYVPSIDTTIDYSISKISTVAIQKMAEKFMILDRGEGLTIIPLNW